MLPSAHVNEVFERTPTVVIAVLRLMRSLGFAGGLSLALKA
jgi:hypothetical protein